ncbi:AI-2E family transporter [Acidiphilium sp.]|uniref:AI-2E family transporter n=1 Tax=Acidiphilium sp. TaxID=527 RepID=UPI003CFDD94C
MSGQFGNGLRWQRIMAIGAAIVLVILFLRLFSSILLPFVAAAGIAYFLDPAVSALSRLRIPRSLGTAIMLLALIAGVALCVLLLYPLITAQISLLSQQLPDMIAGLQSFATHEISNIQKRFGQGFVSTKLQSLVSNEAGTIMGFAGSAARRVVGTGFVLINILTLLIITPIVAFYFLRDWPFVIARIDSWLPRSQESVIRNLSLEISRILNAWLRGQAICCLFLAVFYATSLSIAGLNLGLVIGLTAGLLSFIPYVGTIVGAISSIVLALGQFSRIDHVIIIAVIFVAGQLLNDYVVAPRFLGDRLGLSAVWVIFALFAGAETFGFLGVMLAVPVTATLGVLARFWLHHYLQSSLYLDPPKSGV